MTKPHSHIAKVQSCPLKRALAFVQQTIERRNTIPVLGMARWKQMIRAVIAAMALSAPAVADVVITYDLGGDVHRTAQRIANLRDGGDAVRIIGTCASACTMHLGLPTACVGNQARLGFHGATGRGKFAAIAEAGANATLAAHYPPAISAQFLTQWVNVKGDQIYWLTGDQVIAMGARECEK